MVKNFTCLLCNYSVCKNIYSFSIQMDLVRVWWTGKHLKELEILRKCCLISNMMKLDLYPFAFVVQIYPCQSREIMQRE